MKQQIFPGTPLGNQFKADRSDFPTGRELAELFVSGAEFLSRNGCRQLSCCHWATDDREISRYNTMVKEGAQVLAFGAGCGGSLGNYAYMQPFDLEKYVSLVDKGVKPFVMLFERDEFAPVFAAIKGQFDSGVFEPQKLRNLSEIPFSELLFPLLERWRNNGLMEAADVVYKLTPMGLFWQNQLNRADLHVKKEIEELIAGGTIEKPVHEDITYEDIHKTQDNLWNFLFFTGYLKKTDERFEVDTSYLTMTIPNEEVRFIYRNNIKEWFENKLKNTDLNVLYNAVLDGNCTVFEEQVNNQLAETISYYDYAESYYHGFLCGLLKGCNRYATISNRESGNGRPDIVLAYPSARGPVIILELKVAKRFQELEAGCDAALEQIEQQNYAAYWENEGYTSITKYGICFYKKECMVKKFSH